mmetsp:Transcript_32254/g.59601  ORF Transcript_32254/g.59601 Transcript_32254/m.59601 type:complete len:92 (-) Transcript_32254:44-319(-)
MPLGSTVTTGNQGYHADNDDRNASIRSMNLSTFKTFRCRVNCLIFPFFVVHLGISTLWHRQFLIANRAHGPDYDTIKPTETALREKVMMNY